MVATGGGFRPGSRAVTAGGDEQAVQAGIAAAPYDGGRYSFRFEETLHRFHNMVADSLVGNETHVPAGDDVLEHQWGLGPAATAATDAAVPIPA